MFSTWQSIINDEAVQGLPLGVTEVTRVLDHLKRGVMVEI